MEDERTASGGVEMSQILAQTRELVRQVAKLLRDPAPDTFLGRKTQEPFQRVDGGEN